MTLTGILSLLVIQKKELDLARLPSQGFFYPKDMKLKIKKAEPQDILEYESRIDRHNMIKSIECIKDIVQKNVMLNKKYSFYDLKSVDIIFIFLEIVKFTKDKPIKVKFKSKDGLSKEAPFGMDYFNYFDFKPMMVNYDNVTREFIIDGYHYSFPSIGVENSLAGYLSSITDKQKIKEIQEITYDFLFFLTGRNSMTYPEIENLIQIFNYDLDDVEKEKVSKIVKIFNNILAYSLIVDGEKVEMKYTLNLETIWSS
jgi:hypothetical protein